MSRIFIGGLPDDATRTEVEREFEHFGRIKDVWVARKPPGFGFIVYDEERDAGDAVREMDGKRVCGNRVRVEFARGPTRGGRGGRGGGRGGGGGGGYGRDRSPPRRRRSRSRSRTPERRRSRSRSRSRDRTTRNRSPSVERKRSRERRSESKEQEKRSSSPERR